MKQDDFGAMAWNFSQRARQLKSSAIRDILKVTMRPEVISFAGGLPSAETFPVERVNAAYDAVLSRNGKAALQYGPTDGYAPLREWIANSLSTSESAISPDQIMMLSGSQQGLDLLGKVLVDAGSKVLVETPTYLGALQAFSVYEPEFCSVATDDKGIIPEAVEQVSQDARLLYTLPNFQNPTGLSLSTERRRALVEACGRLGVPLIEDDPYGALSYNGASAPRLLNMNPDGVAYLGSFSKVLTPGIRLGYVVAPRALIAKLEQAKQATDLHTATVTQMVVHEVIKDGFLDQHIPSIRTLYAAQCQAMLDALQQHFPQGVTWTRPEGGMFIWITLPEHIDSTALLEDAIKENIAFVPGAPFYANEPRHNTMRLSFVTVPPEKIKDGIARLGRLIAARL